MLFSLLLAVFRSYKRIGREALTCVNGYANSHGYTDYSFRWALHCFLPPQPHKRSTSTMDSHKAKGMGKEFSARIKRRWGKLTDDELTEAEGNKDLLIAKIQQRYGESREAIEKNLDELRSKLD
jgi:uncharacterized protein YjbJ (UPF0337 family)